MTNFARVASASDLKPGEGKVVDVNGEEVALFNVNGEFFAIGNICPHRGGSLGEGFLEGESITCPLHGWQFNVKTGGNERMPGPNVPKYEVKVEGNDVMVAVD